MADYFSPTVVRPSIPAAAITPLELDILSQMFDCEQDGSGIYFCSSEGPADTVSIAVDTLKASLAISSDTPSVLADIVRGELGTIASDLEEIDLDLSILGEARIFRDIVRRCAQLDAVTIVSAWTCSKMRPDGFGGGITVVTADHILSNSTAQMECELLDRVEHGELGCAPGHGRHVLLRLDEADVRRLVDDDAAARGIGTSGVTDDAIRVACLDVQTSIDLAQPRNQAIAEAAVAALRAAERRHETAR